VPSQRAANVELLTLITFGLALPFFAYYFLRMVINKTELHEIA
jgi:hypothetical protein